MSKPRSWYLRIGRWLLVAVLLAAPSRLPAAEDPVLSGLKKAESRLAAGEIEKASEIVVSLLRQYPDDARPYLTASYIAFQQNRVTAAIENCIHSAEISPSSGALLNLAQIYASLQWDEVATMTCRFANRLDPSSLLVMTKLAQFYDRDTLPQLSAETLDKVFAIDPDFAPARIALANMQYKQGQIEDASRTVQAVLEHHPDHHVALSLYAEILEGHNLTDEARVYWKKALELNPTSARIHHGLAKNLQKAGMIEEAIAHYRAAVDAAPDYEASLFALGTLLNRTGKKEEAKEILARFRQARKRSDLLRQRVDGVAPISEGRGWDAFFAGDATGAIEIGRALAEEVPYDPAGYFLQAAGLIALGTPHQAIPLTRRGERLAPCHARSLNNLGAALWICNFRLEARRAWVKSLFADPFQEEPLINLLRSEFQLTAASLGRIATAEKTEFQKNLLAATSIWLGGNRQDAAEQLQKISEQFSDEWAAHMHLALARLGNKQPSQAVVAFLEAAEGQTERRPTWIASFLYGLALIRSGRQPEGLHTWDAIGLGFSFSILPPALSAGEQITPAPAPIPEGTKAESSCPSSETGDAAY